MLRLDRFVFPIDAPTELEVRNLRNLYLCNLNHGGGLERVEVYGEAKNFASFQYVPGTVREMHWEGKQPRRWQGDFKYRKR